MYVGTVADDGFMWKDRKQDVTEDFKRCVVSYCNESVEFEVDGMKFRVTCERVK